MSKLSNVGFGRKHFDTGNSIMVGKCKLSGINTPGHTPDSISVILTDPSGEEYAIFSGDSLLIGDVGRPDLLDTTGGQGTSREALASAMFHTVHEVLAKLPGHLKVFPGHGAGSLCGKAMSKGSTSTIAREKLSNYAFSIHNELEFIDNLLDGQPFVPHYFLHCVKTNLAGAPVSPKKDSSLPVYADVISGGIWVDVRPSEAFRKGHFPGVINIPCEDDKPFETWLGAIIKPTEYFYIIAENEKALNNALMRAAKIGYDMQIKAGAFPDQTHNTKLPEFSPEHWQHNPDEYQMWDVRNTDEFGYATLFEGSQNKPLPTLRQTKPVKTDKRPIVVHCGEGYRSAIGVSIVTALQSEHTVYDMGYGVSELIEA